MASCFAITDKGIGEVLRSDNFCNIEVLDISRTFASNDTLSGECMKIDESMLIKYFRSHNFKSLELLDLSGTLITNKTLEAFNANSYNFCRLIQLETRNCRNINGEGLRKFAYPTSSCPQSCAGRKPVGAASSRSPSQRCCSR
ncbi:unnamed protein product [Sphagnum balticum]